VDRILIVDDEAGMRDMLSILLRKEGYGVAVADRAEKAIEMASKGEFDLVMSDISMPGKSGIEVLRQTKAASPDTPVILITAYASTESAVEALKLGAYDYLIKPFDVEELKNIVRNALEKRRLETENRVLKRELKRKIGSDTLVGEAPRMREVLALIERIAPTHSTVLIGGESGTGKELAARAIHAQSPRRDGPFVALHCGALPEALLESELFGYEKGAFTGAAQRKPGRLELADGGTLFLDEIGDVPLSIQVKLLRALQERTFERLGGIKSMTVDVRFVAATHRDLEAMARAGNFREDLLYRLSVVPIRIPPLRERPEDIPVLLHHFCAELGRANGRPSLRLDPAAVTALAALPWPGNVRQLMNVVERLVVLADGDRIRAEDVEREIGAARAIYSTAPSSLDVKRRDAERGALVEALDKTGGNRTVAARLLGISRRTLYNKLAEHGIS